MEMHTIIWQISLKCKPDDPRYLLDNKRHWCVRLHDSCQNSSTSICKKPLAISTPSVVPILMGTCCRASATGRDDAALGSGQMEAHFPLNITKRNKNMSVRVRLEDVFYRYSRLFSNFGLAQ